MPPAKPDWLHEVADVDAALDHRPTKQESTERASVTARPFHRYYDSWDAVLETAQEFTAVRGDCAMPK